MNAIKNVTRIVLIGLALIVQLMDPTRAYADGETPPPAADPAASEWPAPEKPLPIEVVVMEKPIALDVSAAQVPAEAEAPVEGRRKAPLTETAAPTEPATLAELLQRIPAETTVVVLDQYAKPLPLAGQDAAALIASGDPVWCPDGQAPTPGANGCTISYATLGALVAAEGGNIAADGTIWITAGPITDLNPIQIDGFIDTTWADYALTLQGGWDGIAGSTTVSSNSIFTAPIAISAWIGDVTINNIIVQNTNDIGLSVDTEGSITAHNITANGNAGDGASLSGFTSITVTGTNQFNNNQGSGLVAIADWHLTLNNITANGNGAFGADLGSFFDITMMGTNQFNNNQGSGLVAIADGDITLNQVIANGNGASGASLETFFDITITGTNTFDNNVNDGLRAITEGTITLNQVTASGNGWNGAFVGGDFGGATLTGTNEFNNNGANGLAAFSFGDITLNNITANGNGWDGVHLWGGDVTITGINTFNNAEDGLHARSDGSITANNIVANGNGIDGATLHAGSDVTVTGTNVFNNNAGDGLLVISEGRNGNLTVNNVTATGNSPDVLLFTAGNATVNGAAVVSVDAEAVCGTLALNGVSASNISYPVSGEHTFVDSSSGRDIIVYCEPQVYVDGQLLGELPVVPSQYEFDLSCDSQTLYPVDLPNGDKVTIVCPVRGKALISRLDNTTIPDDLPAGYTYASAFSVSILQADEPIPVITEGGHVEVSFQVPSQQEGTYSILFWDNGTWVPLNDFLLGSDNNPQSSALNPGVATDTRTILSGVQMVTRNGVQRVEVSTNFPGVFALAQH